ncbi:acetyl-CoA sensor PanZ family protein [Pseudomonas koreensis]|uniref:acetyl-CoA sensor PanZ family protein n=1 Tax=Pseudomonas koreensis TaxID=198620 RepID=UPI002FC8CA48
MPITVQVLQDASYQDQQDLQKIYRDAPAWLLAPFSGESALIESSLADGSLIAGRFNDRLLGAGRLQRHHNVWYLSHLCVRKVTRRRGVAERLVNQAQEMASQAGAELRLLAPVGQVEAQALAGKLHIILDVLATGRHSEPGHCSAILPG